MCLSLCKFSAASYAECVKFVPNNVVWLYHPPYTLYYLDSHSSVSIGQTVSACWC